MPDLVNELYIYLEKRLVNINSHLEKKTNKKKFVKKFSQFLVELLTEHFAVFEKNDFLEFWSTALLDKRLSKKYKQVILAMSIILVEAPSNCFAEGLGRQGTLIRSKLRKKMSPCLLEMILIVSMNSSTLGAFERHLESIMDLHMNVISKNSHWAMPANVKRKLEEVFNSDLKMPKTYKKSTKRRIKNSIAQVKGLSSTQRRSRARVYRTRCKNSIFESIDPIIFSKKRKRSGKHPKKKKVKQ